jgi:hypothetical protein
MKHFVMTVNGAMKDFTSFYPADLPVKLWSSMNHGAPPPTMEMQDEIVAEAVLEVVEKMENGVTRRTYWRLG